MSLSCNSIFKLSALLYCEVSECQTGHPRRLCVAANVGKTMHIMIYKLAMLVVEAIMNMEHSEVNGSWK